MPDVYADITNAETEALERIAQVLELRASDSQQRDMLKTYLADIPFPPSARVLEIGCGTGAVTRVLAERPGVVEAIGLDPSPLLLDRARTHGGHLHNLFFDLGDGRALHFEDGHFDVVVLHTTLCHVPQPEVLLAEVRRVLKPEGHLAIFDADYASMTFATGPSDPLQRCANAAINVIAYDPWLVRKLPFLLAQAGFSPIQSRGFHYLAWPDPTYLLTVVDRGAETLRLTGEVDEAGEAALRQEARQRIEEARFYASITYASVIATPVA